MRSVAFQSILRKRIRKLPKFLKILKIIQYYSILFNRVLTREESHVQLRAAGALGAGHEGQVPAPRVPLRGLRRGGLPARAGLRAAEREEEARVLGGIFNFF